MDLRGQLSGPSGPGSNPALDFVRKLKNQPKTRLTHEKEKGYRTLIRRKYKVCGLFQGVHFALIGLLFVSRYVCIVVFLHVCLSSTSGCVRACVRRS